MIHLVDFMNLKIIQMFDYRSIQPGKVDINKTNKNLFSFFYPAWLRGTRKEPPTLNETITHEHRRQQLEEKVDLLFFYV